MASALRRNDGFADAATFTAVLIPVTLTVV